MAHYPGLSGSINGILRVRKVQGEDALLPTLLLVQGEREPGAKECRQLQKSENKELHTVSVKPSRKD